MVAAPCSQMFSVKAKQYTKIGFCKHYRREIGGAVTEFSFIFNQHCLVLQFGLSLVRRPSVGSSPILFVSVELDMWKDNL